MTMTNGGDQTAQLTVLGTGRLPQPEGGPSVSLLEVFPNRFPHRPYVVSMAFPEYTSLCPVTGEGAFLAARRDVPACLRRALQET